MHQPPHLSFKMRTQSYFNCVLINFVQNRQGIYFHSGSIYLTITLEKMLASGSMRSKHTAEVIAEATSKKKGRRRPNSVAVKSASKCEPRSRPTQARPGPLKLTMMGKRGADAGSALELGEKAVVSPLFHGLQHDRKCLECD